MGLIAKHLSLYLKSKIALKDAIQRTSATVKVFFICTEKKSRKKTPNSFMLLTKKNMIQYYTCLSLEIAAIIVRFLNIFSS